MAKTIGLRRALTRDASEEEPAVRRRPTASARRQRQRTGVVEDVPAEVDADADDVDHGAPIEAEFEGSIDASDVDGFPGGPQDTSVLSHYDEHIAPRIWRGEERPELKLASHGRKVHKFGRPAPEIEGLVAGTGLSPLITCLVDTGDRGLISAFVERWHKETSSFHLPIGEMTITLDDVACLFHLPVMGALQTYDVLDVDEAIALLVDLLEVTHDQAAAETKQCHGPYVRLSWLRELYDERCQQMQWTVAARAYLLHLVGCTIFANKSATHIGVVFLEPFCDLHQSGGFSWGAAALQHMYDNLNYACQHHGKHLAGYISLLQCWVYEYFPSVGSMIADEDYVESQPRACRWKPGKALPVSSYRRRLDRLTTDAVCWTPYIDHRPVRPFEVICLYSGYIRWGPYCVRYLPKRVLRQFGFIQTIPILLSLPTPSDEEVDDSWLHYVHHLTITGPPSGYPGQCEAAYMDWFYQISHPFMCPPKPGEDRAPPHVPVTTDDPPSTTADPTGDIAADEPDMPRHAMAAFETIAERLQRLIDLRMVTSGTDVYETVADCVTLARSVCDDRRVYVRSRRRRTGPRGD